MAREEQAFFDVDSRDVASGRAGLDLALRPRMEPLAAPLEVLYDAAAQGDHPLVMTTCCSGRRPSPSEGRVEGRLARRPFLFVPMDGEDRRWERHVARHRLFYLDKPAFASPEVNLRRCAYDVFAHNHNAANLVQAIDAARWVVFGNGLDLCVDAVVRGLAAAGARVTIVEDVLVSSATGTDASRHERLASWRDLGAETALAAEVLEAATG